MALILRLKFIRYFTHLVPKRIYVPLISPAVSTLKNKAYVVPNFMNYFSTKAVPLTSHDTNLDRSLRRLDQDARRSGRISRRELEDVLEELRHTRSATSTQSLLLIRCCGNLVPEELPEIRTQLVQEIWKTLESLGVPMDISHYNALLRVYLENEHFFSPTEFLADLEKKGIEPNRVTYQRLIARYCQQGDMDGATQILEFMQVKQLPVNEAVFNALILGHSQADDMESAAGIINVMKQAGLDPSSDTYTTLLCGYAKHGNMNVMKKILEECEQNDIQPSDREYMDIVYALAVNGHGQHVDEIMALMTHSAGYNQDAVNLILRLVNKKQLETAKKVVMSMSRGSGESALVGNFFFRQLVKANYPIEEIVSQCMEFEDKGLNTRALLVATEASLLQGRVDYCYSLFNALKERGYYIRRHFFWPLIASCGKANNIEGILNVLKNVQFKFGQQVGGAMLREYAVPHLYRLSSEKNRAQDVIVKLQSIGVSRAAAAASLVTYLLTENDLPGAASVAKQHRAAYSPNLLRRPLIQAFRQSNNGTAFAVVLRQLYNSTGQLAESRSMTNSSSDEEDDMSHLDRLELVGQIVLEAVGNIPRGKPEVIAQMLQGMKDQGLGFSNSVAERLIEKIGNESLSSTITELLEKLTSGEIATPVPQRSNYGSVGEQQLKNIIGNEGEKYEHISTAKRQLLSLYCRNRDIEKADVLRKEMEKEDLELSLVNVAHLIEIYTFSEQLDKAMEIYEAYRTKPNFYLDKTKVIKFATLLAKNGCLEDALQLLETQSTDENPDEQSYMLVNACRNFLFYYADQGLVEELNKIFDALLKHNYMQISNIMLGPLVKVHIVRNDLDGALRQFEQACVKYQCTPLKTELSCKLIEAEDANALQKLTDLSTKIHGEVNSLYDLVFAFLDCGRVRQARKILETPGLHLRVQRVNTACKHFQETGKISSLEGLMEATKELPYIDRTDICQHLLVSYCENKDTEKALGLWMRMQEENIQPTEEFLYLLGNFLKDSGMNVPFAIPVIQQAKTVEERPKSVEAVPTSPELRKFQLLIRLGQFEDAMAARLSLSQEDKQQISRTQNSTLLEGLVNSNSLEQVRALMLELAQNKQIPVIRIFKFAVNKLASSGDVNTIKALDEFIDDTIRRQITYDNKLCQAYLECGQVAEYLEILEKEVDQVENIQKLQEKFPVGSCVGILERHPQFHEQLERIAQKHQKRGSFMPMNAFWSYYLINQHFEKADKVWKEFLSSSPRLLFGRIMQNARDSGDDAMAEHLVSYLNDSSLTGTGKALGYNCLIEVLLTNGKINEAFKAFHDAEERGLVEFLQAGILEKLDAAAKVSGKEINIPRKS